MKEGGEGDGKAAEEKLKRLRKRNAELVAQTRQLDDKTKSLKLENEQLVNIPPSLFLLPPSLSPPSPFLLLSLLTLSYFPSLALTSLSLLGSPSLRSLPLLPFLPSSRSTTCTCMYTVQLRVCTVYNYMYMYVQCTTTCTYMYSVHVRTCTYTCVFPSES